MAQPDLAEELKLSTSIGDFSLREVVHYPNGGSSSFYEYESIAIIVDDGICDCPEGQGVGVTRMGVASYHPIATMPESTPAA